MARKQFSQDAFRRFLQPLQSTQKQIFVWNSFSSISPFAIVHIPDALRRREILKEIDWGARFWRGLFFGVKISLEKSEMRFEFYR